MEEIKPITESKVETIKGREYDVETIKRPRYTEEEQNDIRAQINAKEAELNAVADELNQLIEKSKTF